MMFNETCCVCGIKGSVLVQLWSGVFACAQHSRSEIVRARPVYEKLRSAEVRHYQEHMKSPGAVVWGSRSLTEFRWRSRDDAVVRLPNGMPILMVPDDAVPMIFTIDDVLASVLMGIYDGKNHVLIRQDEAASQLAHKK